ncbi:hypothetical protein [Thermococcus sp.]|uniref:hypothetical protein n=1 Tax=Thermococcus sp. TaxID=35749 RepID=UPI00262FE10D|nr:hypothetical protein [Thermococcus sp.]
MEVFRLLKVEPSEYYPVVDKLFASKLAEALEALGVKVDDISVLVEPAERTLHLRFEIAASKHEGFLPIDIEDAAEGILDKLIDEANSSFGRLYSVEFTVDDLRIREASKKEKSPGERLIVNGPEEFENKLERLGRGLIITLREWGVEFSTLTLSVPSNGTEEIKVVLKTLKRLSQAEKDSLKKALKGKTISFSRTILMGEYPVEVRILDPEDKALARVMQEEKSVEELVRELVQDEDVRELLNVLGKSPPEL